VSITRHIRRVEAGRIDVGGATASCLFNRRDPAACTSRRFYDVTLPPDGRTSAGHAPTGPASPRRVLQAHAASTLDAWPLPERPRSSPRRDDVNELYRVEDLRGLPTRG